MVYEANEFAQPDFTAATGTNGLPATIRLYVMMNQLHQPANIGVYNRNATGFQFWNNFYNKYEVLHSTIRVTVRQIGSAGDISPIDFACLVDDDTTPTAFTTYDDWRCFVMDPKVQKKTLFPNFFQNGSTAPRISFVRKYTGKRNRNDPCTFAAGPGSGQRAMFRLYAAAQNFNAVPTAVMPILAVTYKVRYTVRLTSPKDMRDLEGTVVEME
jgi:hypothetical protein